MSLKTLGQANPSSLEMVFRSNVTPEITVDLSSALAHKEPAPDAVSGSNTLALKLIKPQVIIEAFNVQKSIAPYGIPQTGAYMYVVGGLAGAAVLGGLLTFGICRNPKVWMPITAISLGSFLAFIFYQLR